MASLKKVMAIAQEDEAALAVVIRDRDGNPYRAKDGTPSTISTLGSESPQYKKLRDQAMKQCGLEGASEEDTAIAVTAAAVTAWHGWDDDGAELPSSPENVRALLTLDHIRSQVDGGAMRRSRFFGGES